MTFARKSSFGTGHSSWFRSQASVRETSCRVGSDMVTLLASQRLQQACQLLDRIPITAGHRVLRFTQYDGNLGESHRFPNLQDDDFCLLCWQALQRGANTSGAFFTLE